MRLATLLRHVGCWSNFSCNICGCCMMLQSCGQVCATMLRLGMHTSSISTHNMSQQAGQTCAKCSSQQCCDLLHSNVAIIWRWLTNAVPAMLGYVALRCCYCLAGASDTCILKGHFKYPNETCLYSTLFSTLGYEVPSHLYSSMLLSLGVNYVQGVKLREQNINYNKCKAISTVILL